MFSLNSLLQPDVKAVEGARVISIGLAFSISVISAFLPAPPASAFSQGFFRISSLHCQCKNMEDPEYGRIDKRRVGLSLIS